jgi:excisionase family DNA binding protein
MGKTIRMEPPSPMVLPGDERPWTVREAAVFLGVSEQTVYLWVEGKKIPHLRVMGRNIRFLRSELETFRASFRQPLNCLVDSSVQRKNCFVKLRDWRGMLEEERGI